MAFFFLNAINENFLKLSLSSPAPLVFWSGAVIALVSAVIAMGAYIARKDFQFHIALV